MAFPMNMRVVAALVVFLPATHAAFHATPLARRGGAATSRSPLLRQLAPSPTLAPPDVSAAATAIRDGCLTSDDESCESVFGPRRLLGYLWPAGPENVRAKLRVTGALALLLAAKLFIVRVPFIFKRCIDTLSSTSAAPVRLFARNSRNVPSSPAASSASTKPKPECQTS